MFKQWRGLIFLLVLQSHAAVTLENITASQREGSKLLDISYDVSSDVASSVNVFLAISNDTVAVSSASVFGDVGATVSTGTDRLMTWNGAVDFNGQLATNLILYITASESSVGQMVYIPSGINNVSDPDFSRTLVSDGFYMDQYEVTKSLWDSVATWGASHGYANGTLTGAGKGLMHPVQMVTWFECVRWCNARSEMDELTPCYMYNNEVYRAGDHVPVVNASANGYRLPTDEEWEYAARGGESSYRFPWGNTISHSNANYYSSTAISYDDSEDSEHHPDYVYGGKPYTSPVGAFEPNGYGLYDVVGNVREWCWDVRAGGRSRRGGCWDDNAAYSRIGHYYTETAAPHEEGWGRGFRTVRQMDGEGGASIQGVAFDSRDYNLAVASEWGSPVPSVGTHAYAWRAVITCSVDATVNDAGTDYFCAGWSGTGSVPVSGSGNQAVVVLSNLTSSITWNWVIDSDDIDSDGMADLWEVEYFGSIDALPSEDADEDGQSNLEEYIAGTNPTNAASYFKITATECLSEDRLVLRWDATSSNRVYQVSSTPNIQHTPFTTNPIILTSPQNSYTATVDGVQGYYKISVKMAE